MLRCKLTIDGKLMKQENKFKCLGIQITNYESVEDKVRQEIAKLVKK